MAETVDWIVLADNNTFDAQTNCQETRVIVYALDRFIQFGILA